MNDDKEERENALVYVNGEFVPKNEARVSVYDHGYLYGDGVFEGIRAYKGRVFRLHDHVDRLFRSAKLIALDIGLSRDEIESIIRETLRRNRLDDAYIRVVISRGKASRMGLSPKLCPKPTIVVITEHAGPRYSDPNDSRAGLSLIISSVRRDAVDATSHEIKSQNYLNCILALIEASALGADDAIMLDSRGFVSEATTSNVFIVLKDKILTPSSASAILHGVTREIVIKIIEKIGIKLEVREVTPSELLMADEVFLLGTHMEIAPVSRIRGITIGDMAAGPVTRKIMGEFRKVAADPNEGVLI